MIGPAATTGTAGTSNDFARAFALDTTSGLWSIARQDNMAVAPGAMTQDIKAVLQPGLKKGSTIGIGDTTTFAASNVGYVELSDLLGGK